MTEDFGRIYDVAIAGGGVAGCYCAYRLRRARPELRIAIIEREARIGGRLRSVRLPGVAAPLELGGAFVSDLHRRAFGLVRELGLGVTPVRWSNRFAFLHGHRLANETYRSAPDAVPYALTPEERGRTPEEMLLDALCAIAPRFRSLWPVDAEASPTDAQRYLQSVRIEDRVLDDWSFAELLRRFVSVEALECFRCAFGSGGNFGGASAYDAIRTIMFELASQRFYMLGGGFQRLPEELAARSGADVRLARQVKVLNADPHRVDLTIADVHGREEIITAKRVILALPPHALQSIGGAEPFHATSLDAVRAFKLFLVFEAPWWEALASDGTSIAIAASHTDLPMQQCYYHCAPGDERALLLAVFADDANAAHWNSSGDVGAALAQLRAMHPDARIPEPVAAVAQMWPAAWHAWKPGARSWAARGDLLRPSADLPVYLCGEAYSGQHGWVEGALSSVDDLLREHFLLDLQL